MLPQKYKAKDNTAGFTLIELLLVLTVVITLSIIVLPSMVKTIKNIETAHFFDVLDSDILFVQNNSLDQSSNNVRIKFYHDHYRVFTTARGTKHQTYPKHVNLGNATYTISYSNTGTVIGAGTFMIYDNDKIHRVTFPLGKGRHYIETIR